MFIEHELIQEHPTTMKSSPIPEPLKKMLIYLPLMVALEFLTFSITAFFLLWIASAGGINHNINPLLVATVLTPIKFVRGLIDGIVVPDILETKKELEKL